MTHEVLGTHIIIRKDTCNDILRRLDCKHYENVGGLENCVFFFLMLTKIAQGCK